MPCQTALSRARCATAHTANDGSITTSFRFLLGFLKWVSNPLILLFVTATNLMNRPHGMTLLVNKGNLRDQVRSWDIRVV